MGASEIGVLIGSERGIGGVRTRFRYVGSSDTGWGRTRRRVFQPLEDTEAAEYRKRPRRCSAGFLSGKTLGVDATTLEGERCDALEAGRTVGPAVAIISVVPGRQMILLSPN